jgi:hypothetical protein
LFGVVVRNRVEKLADVNDHIWSSARIQQVLSRRSSICHGVNAHRVVGCLWSVICIAFHPNKKLFLETQQAIHADSV